MEDQTDAVFALTDDLYTTVSRFICSVLHIAHRVSYLENALACKREEI